MNDFAERLRTIRLKRGLTQAALARASGVSQSAIASYESRTRLGPMSIFDIAQALDVDPEWLATGRCAEHCEPSVSNLLLTEIYTSDYLTKAQTWPFKTISPSQYWSMTESQRKLLEATIATMIDHFSDS